MLTIILQRMSSPSSVPMVSDLSNNIQSAVVFGGDGLIKQVSQLLDSINKELKNSSHPNAAQRSLSVLKLNASLSERLYVAGGIIVSQGETVVFSLLQGIRTAHGYPLHFGSPVCFGEIRNRFYQGRGAGRNAERLKEATELIVEASIMCCAQIKASIMCCTHSIMCCTHSHMEVSGHSRVQVHRCLTDAIDMSDLLRISTSKLDLRSAEHIRIKTRFERVLQLGNLQKRGTFFFKL